MTIKTELSVRGLGAAIKQVESYKMQLLTKTDALIDTLVKYGVEVAKTQVVELGAVESGGLLSSIGGYFDASSHTGIIQADVDYAVYIEFGTGIVGKGNPHPMAGPQGWVYDINDHGEAGWVYWDDYMGGFRWTKGIVERPFMYNTILALQQKCYKIATEVFGA